MLPNKILIKSKNTEPEAPYFEQMRNITEQSVLWNIDSNFKGHKSKNKNEKVIIKT